MRLAWPRACQLALESGDRRRAALVVRQGVRMEEQRVVWWEERQWLWVSMWVLMWVTL